MAAVPEKTNEWGQVYNTGDRARSQVEGNNDHFCVKCYRKMIYLFICDGTAEVMSAIEYDRTGDFLATGNKGGRVTIYSRNGVRRSRHRIYPGEWPTLTYMFMIYQHDRPMFAARDAQYSTYTEFQSHTAEFDYLKSLEIEEKINQIKWCRSSNNARYLLSTNDKTIKLWKVHERNVHEVTQYNAHNQAVAARPLSKDSIRLPSCSVSRRVTASTTKRVFANAHTYHINSIALNSDGETFMSADDLRVNLWSLGISNQCFSMWNSLKA